MTTSRFDHLRVDKPLLIAELERDGAKVLRGDKVFCPYHPNTDTPAGHVWERGDGTWAYKCFSCGYTGDVFDIRAKRKHITVSELFKEMHAAERDKNAIQPQGSQSVPSNDSDATNPEQRPSKAKESGKSKEPLTADELRAYVARAVEVYKYYRADGTLPALVVKFPPKPSGKKDFSQLITLPDGRFQFGSLESGRPLWNLLKLKERGDQEVWITEGEKCANSLLRIGVMGVSAMGGAQAPPEKTDWSPLDGKDIIVWPDKDVPGTQFADKLIPHLWETIKPKSIRRVDCFHEGLGLEEGGDAANLFQDHPKWSIPEHGKRLIERIKEKLLIECECPQKDWELYMKDAEQGKLRSWSSPWPILDRTTKWLSPMSVTTLVAKPGVGKSFFLLQLLIHCLEKSVPMSVMMLEMAKGEHMKRAVALIQNDANFTNNDWIANNPDANSRVYSAMRLKLHEISDHLFVPPRKGKLPYDAVQKWAEERLKAGDKIIAIDPITAVDTGNQRWNEDKLFVNEMARMFEEYRAALIVSIHPKDDSSKANTGMGNAAGGKAFERFVSQQFFLDFADRDKKYELENDGPTAGTRLMHNNKVRNESGSNTKILMDFGKERKIRFEELGVSLGLAKLEPTDSKRKTETKYGGKVVHTPKGNKEQPEDFSARMKNIKPVEPPPTDEPELPF